MLSSLRKPHDFDDIACAVTPRLMTTPSNRGNLEPAVHHFPCWRHSRNSLATPPAPGSSLSLVPTRPLVDEALLTSRQVVPPLPPRRRSSNVSRRCQWRPLWTVQWVVMAAQAVQVLVQVLVQVQVH